MFPSFKFIFIFSENVFEVGWSKLLRFSFDLLLDIHTCNLGGIWPIQIHIAASRNQVQMSHFLVESYYYLNHGDRYKNWTKLQRLQLAKLSLVKLNLFLINSLKENKMHEIEPLWVLEIFIRCSRDLLENWVRNRWKNGMNG